MALCDDIIDYNKKMESYIEKYGNENHVEVKITSYGSGSQLLLNYQKRKFDVIFLDVSMPEMDGFETAEEIRKSDTDVSIVFCTSYYTITNAGKGFEVAAEDFLSKPLLYRKVENILNKIYKKKLLNAEEKLFLKCHDGLITLQLSDIIYIQTENKLLILHTIHGDVQSIVANALKILSNDKGNSAFNGELNSSILMEATDWPDKLGNETDAGTFAGHFYDPDTGKNWLGQKSPTARTRAESYFQAAVNAYRAGDVQLAMSNLGKGTHYVSDLNEPHHASNLTAVNSNHSAFEKYVDKNRKSYTIAGNSFGSSVYTTALNTSTGDLMYSAAKHAKGLAADAQKESSYDSAGRQSVQHAIQTVTQYMYKFGKEVGIY